MKTIKINVKTKSSNYSIVIGSGVVYKISKFLNENSIKFNKCLIVVDKKIPKYFIKKIVKSLPKKQITTYFFNARETNKNQFKHDQQIHIDD